MGRLVLAWVVSIFLASSVHAQSSAWADKLFGGELTHDFGVVARGAQLTYDFKMTNIWKVPLEITDVRVSCGCLKAIPSTKVLQPSETATLHIHMDGRQFSGQKVIRINVKVGPKYISTATLTVSANARGDVAFAPNELDFGNLHKGQTPTKSVEIEYTGALANWRVTEIVKNASAPFELKVEPLDNLASRRGYRIIATLKADASVGQFKQDVILKTNDASGPVLTFPVTGNIQDGLAVSPSPIVVKGLKVGEAQTKKVLLRASRAFKVTAVDGQGDGVTVEIPKQQDVAVVLTVTINPTKAGVLRKTLMIRTDLDNEATLLVVEGTIEP